MRRFIRNSPRWLVFLADMVIVLCSLVLAYLLRFNFTIPQDQLDTLNTVIPIVLIARGILFFLGRTYAGIVEYTSIKDAERIILTNFTGSIFFYALNLVLFHYFIGEYLIPTSVIIIEFITTVSSMTALRLAVKMLAAEFNIPGRQKKSNVIIFGTTEQAVLAKRSIDYDKSLNYKVIAFVDPRGRKVNSKIEGVSIYPLKQFEDLLERDPVETVIFADKNLSSKLKNEITDKCLFHDIKVQTVPDLNHWINGELSAKQIKKIRIEDLLGREPIRLDVKEIRKDISGKRVLITGGAGSIGSELCRQISRYNPGKMIILDQAESALYDLELELLEKLACKDFEVVIGDVTDKPRMKRLFEHFKPQVVYHAAAYKHVPMMENNPAEAVRNNVFGTKIVADLCLSFKVEKFVMISTDKAVNPTNVMGASKRLSEVYVQSMNGRNGTKFITTRFGNVLGSNGSVIPRFRKQIENGGPVTVTHPEITRYFMTIPEACQLVLEAGALGQGGEIFIFDMGESVKIADLAKKMIKLSGLDLGKDIQLKFTGLRPGEKLYEELLNHAENTIETHHPQIMIARVREYDYDWVNKKLIGFKEPLEQQDNEGLVRLMKEVVPEYKSMNSVYEKLD